MGFNLQRNIIDRGTNRFPFAAFRYLFVILFFLTPDIVQAGYLDENPEEVFSSVYDRLGVLPLRAARDPFIWLRLEELKREPCDQKSVGDLALMLDKLGYRREAASGLYRFFQNCGAPLSALQKSVDIYLKLSSLFARCCV